MRVVDATDDTYTTNDATDDADDADDAKARLITRMHNCHFFTILFKNYNLKTSGYIFKFLRASPIIFIRQNSYNLLFKSYAISAKILDMQKRCF